MLTPDIVVEIERLVREKVSRRERFTAYDITLELRALQIQGFHSEFKEVVHRLFELGHMPDYTREVKDLGGSGPAWEYSYQDASQPTADHLMPSSLRVYRPQSRPRRLSPRRSRTLKDGRWNVPVDGRGTVCVPAALVRAAGLAPGKAAYVFASSGRLIVASDNQARPPDRTYTVDKHANIRITRSVQHRAGLNVPVVTISMEVDGIVVGSLS
jgi:hypothetical protein